MIRPALAAAVLLLSSSAMAASLPAVDASGLITPAVADGLKAIKAAAPRWTDVRMTITVGTGATVINEPSLHIDLTGAGPMGNGWFSGTAGGRNMLFSASAFGRGWTLYGSDVNVAMTRFGGGWDVSGFVGGTSINYTIGRWGPDGQSGAVVEVTGPVYSSLYLFGRIDEKRFDAKALAVMGATMALASPAAN